MALDHLHQDPAQTAAAALIPPKMLQAGILTWGEYCRANDERATAHLPASQVQSILRRRARRHPTPFFDDSGKLCLRVPLDGLRRRFALAHAADWVMLQEGGWHGLWCANAGRGGRLSVKACRPMAHGGGANEQTAARVILNLGSTEKAKFVNGDSLDLRRPNLTKQGARGLYPARAVASQGIAEARAMAAR